MFARSIRSLRHPARRDPAEWALACVLIDGPRRLVLVAVATLGLLVGVSPVPDAAPAALIVALTVGVARALVGHDRAEWSADPHR